MSVSTQQVLSAQQILNEQASAGLTEDGVIGPNTLNATSLISIDQSWIADRKIIGTIQHGAQCKDIEVGPVDGYWGPQTQYAFDVLCGDTTLWRNEDPSVAPNPTSTPFPPQHETALTRFYGAPGTNQGKVNSPYPLKIAWNTEQVVNRFTCHEKLVVPIRAVLERVQDHYGDQISDLGLDMWGGCYNKRKMRGGSQWSTHSWGIAIDWDPTRNQLKWKANQANFAKPEYDVWWKLWEDEGFTSLGRIKNYDWMHIQAADVG